ncbi:MAG: HlyD family efflux transporter periplasmic adaptor subunit, partial [Planctomycetes bacterium]|nr:HlyD family efflux transporter periplasmic adaptor subunit [Planctomycetota bacterium]
MPARSHRPLLLLLAAACAPAADHDHGAATAPEWPSRALTTWTDRFEYFIEHDLVLPGRPAGLAVHVTRLADGAPRTEGPLRMVLRLGEATVERHLEAPARPGIYLDDFVLPEPGAWTWSIEVDGDRPQLPEVRAHADEGELAAAAAALGGEPDGVTMLKEQQWPLRLLTARASIRPLQQRFPATVVAATCPGHSAQVLSPMTGQLLPVGDGSEDWPELGSHVAGGDLLARLRVPVVAADRAAVESAALGRAAFRAELERGLAESAGARERAQAELAQAEKQHGRIAALAAVEAKAPRELEQAEAALASAGASAAAAIAVQASWRAALERFESRTGNAAGADPFLDLELRAPIAGRLVAAPTGPGGWVDASSLVFEVLDTSTLHFRARLPEERLVGLKDPRVRVELAAGAWFELPGEDGELLLDHPLVDERTRMGEIVYEAPNPGDLSPGAVRQGWLADGPPRQALAVPVSALVDEDGLTVVYR